MPPWPKGVSGNPSGRPRTRLPAPASEMAHEAREHGLEAIKTLVKIMRTSKRPSEQLGAATALLDRAYGRAVSDLTVIRQELKSALSEFCAGNPERLAELKRRLELDDGARPTIEAAVAGNGGAH